MEIEDRGVRKRNPLSSFPDPFIPQSQLKNAIFLEDLPYFLVKSLAG